MIRLSIRRKIMGIAVGLIVLMAITAVLTMVLAMQVGTRIEELTSSYIPAYRDLARANVRSLERALSLRRLVIEKIQSSSNDGQYAALRDTFEAQAGLVEREVLGARTLIRGLIEKGPSFGDAAMLGQLESRIDALNSDSRRRLSSKKIGAYCCCSIPATPKRSTNNSNVSTSCATNSIRSWKVSELI